ncbi:DNA-binding transcriptional regulator, AcrR family [Parafrankia irregularis]|uniref:DNA-binding transcriptional regulator, AcrR family n=1 Tax=Parafrankia irregularis TaxID=795642 RepID=A0A0S4QP25_9ACTN|nr:MULTISPECIES: TetR/AcrR family transcriptional regulator [Parafrankia]MBE3200260.1 TetR/AcrR family transcriptional regulator [Parafrankia sp. CH37]CUU56540.1 DNA-binding transcriptional regulator, AcrR family [Parafrankia irregularis]
MEKDRRILEVAAEAFYQNGFHGVGVDEIGRRAGLSGPAIYRHFGSKDEILATLLNEAMDELMSATLPVHGNPGRDLDRALRHHADFAVAHRHLVNLYQREIRSLAAPWRRAFDRRRVQYTERWERLVADRFPGMPQATVAAVTQACLGMVFSVSYWPARSLAHEDLTGLLLELLDVGLRGHDRAGGEASGGHDRH